MIASGPGAPWWERGALTVAADGSVTGVLTENSGNPDPQATTLHVSSVGDVTVGLSTVAGGVMDLDKSVMVMTDTWSASSPGTTGLSVFLKRAATSSLAELAGTWQLFGLATGPGAPWWERAQATIGADGSVDVTTTESTGASGAFSATFALSSAGVLTLAGSPGFRGVLDAGKTVLVSTDTWGTGSPGTSELKVGVKKAGSYAPSDVAGTWVLLSLASGPGAPWWRRARATIAADGTFAATATDNAGGSTSLTGQLGLSSDGAVTLHGASVLLGAMDAHKTVMVWTDTWSSQSPGTTELTVAVKVN